ncbi:MAG: hypothetical protein AAF533_23685 [Acidobacteriota bacterium]
MKWRFPWAVAWIELRSLRMELLLFTIMAVGVLLSCKVAEVRGTLDEDVPTVFAWGILIPLAGLLLGASTALAGRPFTNRLPVRSTYLIATLLGVRLSLVLALSCLVELLGRGLGLSWQPLPRLLSRWGEGWAPQLLGVLTAVIALSCTSVVSRWKTRPLTAAGLGCLLSASVSLLFLGPGFWKLHFGLMPVMTLIVAWLVLSGSFGGVGGVQHVTKLSGVAALVLIGGPVLLSHAIGLQAVADAGRRVEAELGSVDDVIRRRPPHENNTLATEMQLRALRSEGLTSHIGERSFQHRAWRDLRWLLRGEPVSDERRREILAIPDERPVLLGWLRDELLRGEPPRYERSFRENTWGSGAPDGLHRQLGSALLLDALSALEEGDPERARADVRAAWGLAESLGDELGPGGWSRWTYWGQAQDELLAIQCHQVARLLPGEIPEELFDLTKFEQSQEDGQVLMLASILHPEPLRRKKLQVLSWVLELFLGGEERRERARWVQQALDGLGGLKEEGTCWAEHRQLGPTSIDPVTSWRTNRRLELEVELSSRVSALRRAREQGRGLASVEELTESECPDVSWSFEQQGDGGFSLSLTDDPWRAQAAYWSTYPPLAHEEP